MIHVLLTRPPQWNKAIFERQLEQARAFAEESKANPHTKFSEACWAHITQNHPHWKPYDPENAEYEATKRAAERFLESHAHASTGRQAGWQAGM